MELQKPLDSNSENESNMADFKKAFSTILNEVEKAIDNFPFESEPAYLYWLAQTYYYSRHTTRLLSLAASRIQMENPKMHRRMVQHVREEMNHETLAIRDLGGFGHSIGEIPELSETKAFYQTQYYWIEHKSPVSFFGFILMLEALAVSRGELVTARTQKAYGEKVASFLTVHAKEDQDHVSEALEYISTLSNDERKEVMNNLALSARLYIAMLKAIQTLNEKESLETKQWPTDPLAVNWQSYFQLM